MDIKNTNYDYVVMLGVRCKERFNGGIVAMTGKDCVAIAGDRRFGRGAQTISMDLEQIFEFEPHLYLGLTGLTTDVQTVEGRLRFRTNLYKLREHKKLTPLVFKNIVANFLYEHRFGNYFVGPIIAGLEKNKNEEGWIPHIYGICAYGSSEAPEDYIVSGNFGDMLHGMCEALWKPNMNADELFETISQAVLNAQDRYGMAGWGAEVHVIEPHQVVSRTLKARMD